MVARLKGRANPRPNRTLRLVRASRPDVHCERKLDVSESRVERLREAYLAGALRVDTQEVARRMLVRLLN